MVLSLPPGQLFKSLDILFSRTRTNFLKSSVSGLFSHIWKFTCRPTITHSFPVNKNSSRPFNMSQTLFRLSANSPIEEYLQANRDWATSANNEVLKSNASGQSPHTLWIGCSDSRCSEFALKNLQPGEIFTHRNIANIVSNASDPSSKAILKFAVNTLKVKKILIAGHTNCGGVNASLKVSNKDNYYATEGIPNELIDWLKPLIDLRFEHETELEHLKDDEAKNKKLVEYNVKQQVQYLLCQNEDIRNAVSSGRLEVHGLIYNVDSGLLELCD